MTDDRPINRISESGTPMTFAQSLRLFPILDEAPVPLAFTVEASPVLHLRLAGRLLIVREVKASTEEGFYFGTHNRQRIGFEPRHVFGEGEPPREVRPFTPHHANEAMRLTQQGHTPASIAAVLRVDQAEVEAAVGVPHGC